MMHRDLKSPNVLLSEEGVAKIADVGMVRAQVKDLVTAQPVMTPLWAAPEVRAPACRGFNSFRCRCISGWPRCALHVFLLHTLATHPTN